MEPFHHSPLQAGQVTRRIHDQDSNLENTPEMNGLDLDERVEVLQSLATKDSTTFEYTAEDHAFLDSLGETQGD